jgi:chromosome segregation ATPase
MSQSTDRPIEPLIEELTQRLVIDKHDLDSHLEEHAELFHQAGELLAEWSAHRDERQKQLDHLSATIDAKLRHDAAVAGEKTTEKEIASQKLLHPKLMTMQDGVDQLDAVLARLKNLVASYTERRHALKGLVDLYMSSYFATPSTSSRKDKLAKEARASQAEQRQRLNRR